MQHDEDENSTRRGAVVEGLISHTDRATYLNNEHAAGIVPIGAVQRFEEDGVGVEQSACRLRATGDGMEDDGNQQTKPANAEHHKEAGYYYMARVI